MIVCELLALRRGSGQSRSLAAALLLGCLLERVSE